MAGKAGEPRVPLTLLKSRLKAEEKILDFDFELTSVQFNETGRYFLRLTAENPLLEGSGAGVRLQVNEGEILYTNTATTDVVEQSNLNEVYTFEKRRFLFTLPKGFCKNDKTHDARLRIEALRLHGSSLKSSIKTGEAFFAIYPRTNQPRMNLFASQDEDLYRYSDIMVLLRAGRDELAMHCGRLAYTVSFHEHRPVAQRRTPITPRRLSPLPPGKQGEVPVETSQTSYPPPLQYLGIPHQAGPVSIAEPPFPFSLNAESRAFGLSSEQPEPRLEIPPEERKDLSDEGQSSAPPSSSSSSPALLRRLSSDASFHLPSPGYSPKLEFGDTFSGVLVKEDPAEPGQPALTSPTNDWHLANPEKESITITLHGANNLPSTNKGNVPIPYVIIKTTSDEENKRPAQAITHTSKEPTHSPTWEEKVTLEMDSSNAGKDDVTLTVADKDTKEILAKYNIPVKYLHPFHHYHCALLLPRKKDPTGTKLYATIVRKRSLIPRYGGVNYTGLEVFLKGINEPLAQPDGDVVAIARIVNNLEAYKEEVRNRPINAPPFPLSVITFPDPTMEDFDVPRVTNHGYPQVSPPGGPPEQPKWETSYLFQGRDGATAFADDAALVIEYYKSGSGGDLESVPKPLGFSVLPLTNRVYRKLVADSSRSGLRIENLPIQDTLLRTTSGGIPTVQLGLQLINSERPDVFLTASTTNGLPLLDPELVGQLGTIKEPWTRPPSKTEQKISVVEPHPENSFIAPDRKTSCIDLSLLPNDKLPPHEAVAEILPERQHARPIIEEVQDLETDNYSAALQKMADDILSLRRHVSNLEAENSSLRRNLAMHEDVGRALFQDTDLDVMTKAEIVDRILALKQKLAAGAQEMARMKDRVQRLQNELIRKNDREKDLVMLKRAHQQQQVLLRKYQAKVARMQALEDAVRQQEKVIERMERMLKEKVKDRFQDADQFPDIPRGAGPGDSWSKDLYTTLLMENMRLRDELGKSSSYRSPIILQQQALPDTFSANTEKLSLISKLEKAEARIHALECQLEESARRWGREKQGYSTRLLEQDLGFVHSPSSPVLQDFLLDEKEEKGDKDVKNSKIYISGKNK
ncbi:coiled-coil domain-containing protein 33 isoform X2 [Pogona vitticeps]